MREGLILLLPGTESAPLLWGHWRDGKVSDTGQIPFAEAETLAAKSLPVAIVLPGQNAQTFAHDIPKMRRRERENAVLFSLEDNLSMPFDSLHVATQDEVEIDESPINLATIISKSVMGEVIDWARENGLNVQHILTDYDAVTGLEPRPLALPDRVVHAGPLGHTLDMDWYDGPLETLDQPTILNAIGRRLSAANNLMQGEFAPKSALSGTLQRGLRIAALAACLGIAVLVFETMEARAISKQAENVQAQTARLYTEQTGQAAPNNPARAVAQAARSGNVAPTQFLALSDIAFRALADFDDVSIERLSFQDSRNELQLRFSYPSFERAEAVKAAMEAAGGDFTPGGVREQSGRFVGEAVLRAAGAS
ncbi:type II secretion system protein GspL [Litorimonas haliclonae]|uniref:type II secretion system protein GspL n=1 Tax=Litorimonas haliclonae TaxID=2081977 RepID=UPI0039EFFF8F